MVSYFACYLYSPGFCQNLHNHSLETPAPVSQDSIPVPLSLMSLRLSPISLLCSFIADPTGQVMDGGVSQPQGCSQQRQQGQLGAPWKGVTETLLVSNPPVNGGFTVTGLLKKLREAL